MNIVEQPQLPLDYVHRIASTTFLLASLDALHYEARNCTGALAHITSSYYLLVSLALCWAIPGSFWYRPGCWLQPLPGRNLIFCGPTAVLRRFRLYAARLGLVLPEDCPRERGTTAISLQSYWALPNNIYMDMAQLDLLTFSMPIANVFSYLAGDQAGYPPLVEGLGPSYYIPALLGVTDQDPRLYLALRRRNFDLGCHPYRVRSGILESMALLITTVRSGAYARQVPPLASSRVNHILGLAQEDCILFSAAHNTSSYLNQVLEQDRNCADKSLYQCDLEYLDDLELIALGYPDEDDEVPGELDWDLF
nr:putative 34.5kDa protein [Red clover enamovirus 1]